MAGKKIGELLVESGLITVEQLDTALGMGKDEKGARLGSILIKLGYASERDIAQTLAFQLSIPFVEISSIAVDPEAIKLVSEKLAQKYVLIPLFRDKKVLKVAMADPLNLAAIDEIRFVTKLEFQPCIATPSEVAAAINFYYHAAGPLEELINAFPVNQLVEVIHESQADADIPEQLKKSAAPPIIKMVDSIISYAVEGRASDIHLEPQETYVNLRFRVDGLMRDAMRLPKWVQGSVISRIKLMANMDITERRVSQDGRIKIRLGKRKLDVRVSTLPTQYGETVVMRLLDKKSAVLDLKGIGLHKDDETRLIDSIKRPHGFVLVTGPTGSGKSSTLYSMIGLIKSKEINIVTLEDPIEYELNDVTQVAVNEKTGLTFAFTLRSVLRQDPDVIMIGEIRDAETATIALQASITGHLVFSTLHTNDAVSSIVRLRNIGVPSYMIAAALNCVVAQRLVRNICPHCRVEDSSGADVLKKADINMPPGVKLYKGAGCVQCNDTGYRGRSGIFEVLTVTDRIKKLISDDAAPDALSMAAAEDGMTTLHTDGLRKVAAGITTLEELSKVIYVRTDHDVEEGGACRTCLAANKAQGEICGECGHSLSRFCPECLKNEKPAQV